MPWTHPT